jgi:predicted anti-sigma-YlaC factor YlaD
MKDHPSTWIVSGLTCREVAAGASDYLEGRVPILTDLRIALHVASCAGCRAYFTHLALVRKVLTQLPPMYPSPIDRLRLRRRFATHSAR